MELVNGYQCRTCADVSVAKRGIDPAHPKDGPNGIYKAQRAEAALAAEANRGPAVKLDGALPGVSPTRLNPPNLSGPGLILDLKI